MRNQLLIPSRSFLEGKEVRIAIVHVVFIAEMVYPIQSHQLLQSMRPYGGDHPLPLCELLREADQAAIPADLESDPPEKDCHQLARELPYDFFEDFGIFCVFFLKDFLPISQEKLHLCWVVQSSPTHASA